MSTPFDWMIDMQKQIIDAQRQQIQAGQKALEA